MALLAVLTLAARAEDVVIESISGQGKLTWSNAASTGLHTVQWAASPTGTWRESWRSLVEIPATGGLTTVDVPMFLRVVYTPLVRVDDEVVGTADGLSSRFTGYLANGGVVPGSPEMTVAGFTFKDEDGDGRLEVTGVPSLDGLVVYGTGLWMLDFDVIKPGGGTPIEADYTYHEPVDVVVRDELIETGDGTNTLFSGDFAQGALVPGSAAVWVGDRLFHDLDADGVFTGDPSGSGTVNYSTGAWTLDFLGNAPTNGQTLLGSYQYTE
jgi:hypothetical protein